MPILLHILMPVCSNEKVPLLGSRVKGDDIIDYFIRGRQCVFARSVLHTHAMVSSHFRN
jgi:hypothetical protein